MFHFPYKNCMFQQHNLHIQIHNQYYNIREFLDLKIQQHKYSYHYLESSYNLSCKMYTKCLMKDIIHKQNHTLDNNNLYQSSNFEYINNQILNHSYFKWYYYFCIDNKNQNHYFGKFYNFNDITNNFLMTHNIDHYKLYILNYCNLYNYFEMLNNLNLYS